MIRGPVKVFISSSSLDTNLLEELAAHLAPLEHDGLIEIWNPGNTAVEATWAAIAAEQIWQSHLIICLLSPNYFVSSYLWEFEMTVAVRRARDNAGTRVVPVIARPCHWKETPLAVYQALPRERAVSTWTNRDEAWYDVVRGIRNLAVHLQAPAIEGNEKQPAVAARDLPLRRQRKIPIGEIFRTSGRPLFTYVDTDLESRIGAELEVMGKGLLVEGPAGIGKSTAVLHCLQKQKGKGRTIIACGSPNSEAQLEALLDSLQDPSDPPSSKYIVVDDFHRLNPALQKRVGTALKLLADRDRPRHKMVLIGIDRVGSSLLAELPDIVGRLAIVSLGRQRDDRIQAMIELGERCANIRFTYRSEFVEIAEGSFLIAQELCYQAAMEAGVRCSQKASIDIDVKADQAAALMMSSYQAAFLPSLVGFATCDSDRPNAGACLVLLWRLKKEESGVHLPSAGSLYPEMTETFQWLLDGEIERCLRSSESLAKLFAFDSRGQTLVMVDPRLRFYLKNLEWAEFARRAGLIADLSNQGRLEIVSRCGPPGEAATPKAQNVAGTGHLPLAASVSSSLEPADIGIVVALSEELREFFEVLAKPRRTAWDSDTGQVVYFFDYPSRVADRSYRCALTLIGQMGPGPTAIATDRLLDAVRPAAVALLGIAGGIDSSLKLGDVLIAAQIDEYMSRGKAVARGPEEGSEFDLRLAGTVYRPNHAILNALAQLEFSFPNQFTSWKTECARDSATLITTKDFARLRRHGLMGSEPCLHAEDIRIATGDVVATAAAFTNVLRRRDRLIHAIEMEAGGLMLAAQRRVSETPSLVIRAISDFADDRKSKLDKVGGGAIRRCAIRNAARILLLSMDLGRLPFRPSAT